MNILVVWSEMPEKVCFVPLIGQSDDNMKKLKRFHNNFVNAGEGEIHNFFYDSEGEFRFRQQDELIESCVWDLIIITGFIL